MSEEFEEQPAQQFDFERYLDIVRRRHLVFLTLLLLGWGAVWGASWLLPPHYTSSTLILVEPLSTPKNYVLPNVSDNLQDQIQSITQQITSRTRLLMIISKLDLYNDKHQLLNPDQKAAMMRNDIAVDLVRDPQSNTITSFRVSYTAPDPHIAQRVTSDLTKLFIDENLSVRKRQSQDTTQFLQGQLEIARSKLAEEDTKVHAFQTAHEGSLPTQEAVNLQILSGLQSQLQGEQEALDAARQQFVIDQYGGGPGSSRIGTGASAQLAAIDRQLEALRTRLADLSTRYTDRYPDVQEAKSEIAQAERAREQIITSFTKQMSEQSHGSEASSSPTLVDPAQSQVRDDEIRITKLEQSISKLRSRINDYQARLNGEPAIAQQLADLTRGYQQSQANYDDLLQKVGNSQMATNMEQLQEGERFTIIDPPSLPLKPDSPNRMKMCAAGVGAGMGLGVLVVALLELLDDRMHSSRDIARLLPTATISEIPEILGTADERRRRRRVILGWTIAVMVPVIILAGAAFTYLST